MQQRRLRLGDILDDYCPRERRITNHAVVAMIDDDVKQTRCTTCDAEHEYKQARVPASRRKKTGEPAADLLPPVLSSPIADESIDTPDDAGEHATPLFAESLDDAGGPAAEPANVELSALEDDAAAPGEDDGPVHRPLIRATLPRPEGQAPERKAPDFTMRQPGGRFDQQRNNQRNRGRQQARNGGQPFGQSSRGDGPRQGAGRPGGDAQRPRNGNRSNNRSGNSPGNAAGQRGGGRPFGSERGPRSGGGHGRKRGR
jgi:hypothetical protein